MLSCNNIHKSYGSLHVLKGIHMDVKAGEIVSITGESGAGKSTLLHILGTLDVPDQGELEYNNQKLDMKSGSKLATFRNENMGFVFQFHHLLPEFTALENVCIPGWIKGLSKKQAKTRALELLAYLGLENRSHHKPGQLSGGEQQRVAVARALMNNPGIVFADEPSGNLDSHNAEILHTYFSKLRQDLGQTFIIVTHNPDLAAMADRKIKLVDGMVV